MVLEGVGWFGCSSMGVREVCEVACEKGHPNTISSLTRADRKYSLAEVFEKVLQIGRASCRERV